MTDEAHDSPHRDRDPRFPNLFIVGVPKSGTTSMHAALARSRGTFMSKVKEPGFFSSDRQFERGLHYYLDSHFAGAARFEVRGESTPWYLYSDDARKRIYNCAGEVAPRIIIILRRPAERAYSMYLDQKRIGNESRSFEDAIDEEFRLEDSGTPTTDIRRRYIWCGLYANHVRQWRRTFGSHRVSVFSTDDLRDTDAIWSMLSRFLDHDLGDNQLSKLPGRSRNEAGELRWPRLDRALRSLEGHQSSFIRTIQRGVPNGWDRRIAQALFARNRKTRSAPVPRPPVSTMRSLDEYFRSDALELHRELGRSFGTWAIEDSKRE